MFRFFNQSCVFIVFAANTQHVFQYICIAIIAIIQRVHAIFQARRIAPHSRLHLTNIHAKADEAIYAYKITAHAWNKNRKMHNGQNTQPQRCSLKKKKKHHHSLSHLQRAIIAASACDWKCRIWGRTMGRLHANASACVRRHLITRIERRKKRYRISRARSFVRIGSYALTFGIRLPDVTHICEPCRKTVENRNWMRCL